MDSLSANAKNLFTVTATVLIVLSLPMGGCNRTDPRLTFSAHSKTPIPDSAKLVHCGAQYAGFDASYGFVFDVSDDTLENELVKEWNLEAAKDSGGGFFKFAKHEWWPTDGELAKMEPCFSREDKQKEEYWSIWRNPITGKLYVEHGRW